MVGEIKRESCRTRKYKNNIIYLAECTTMFIILTYISQCWLCLKAGNEAKMNGFFGEEIRQNYCWQQLLTDFPACLYKDIEDEIQNLAKELIFRQMLSHLT